MRILLAIMILAARPGIAAANARDCELVVMWNEGRRVGTVCRHIAVASGLTVIELSRGWAPRALAPGADGVTPDYHDTYVSLAQERFGDAGLDGTLAVRDRYLELYGITPSLEVVHGRLADDARHRCHDTIDDAPLAAAPDGIVEESNATARARLARARRLRAELEYDRTRRKLPDLDALFASSRYHRRAGARLARLDAHAAAVRVVQGHLACDGLRTYAPIAGGYTWHTANEVQSFQRAIMVFPTGHLDRATRAAFELGSRERDFLTALRVLRERVVDATGLIEDGTAGAGPGSVLGRRLELGDTWPVRGHEPLDGAAPDLVSAATEAAARALGWLDPTTARAWLAAVLGGEDGARAVAVALPPVPRYHGPAMALSVEIDRGDVWHDPVPRRRVAARRPALILFTMDGERRIPLVRWPTTIGGWQDENTGGVVDRRWKESPVGPRIWRDLHVGPRWLPPSSTPDRELVRREGDQHVLARELLGPSYRAAFGVVAFVHHAERTRRGQTIRWYEGIRTHGTGNLTSLANGVSHGCHRMLGLHVVRLASFVLMHRGHIRHGPEPTYYRRIVRDRGRFPIAIDVLGDQIELDPPIPVEVLPGRVHRQPAARSIARP